MSSLRNAVPRKAHKERAQPHSRRKFGLLEKHKDYVERAKAYHKKEKILQRLKEKAAFRNLDEFYFKMIKARTVGGVHRSESEANNYTKEDLMLMKTQDIGYISLKLQSEKKTIERLNSILHSLDNQSSSRHVYYADDRNEAREIRANIPQNRQVPTFENLPKYIKRKMAASYRELKARKSRVIELAKICLDMELQKELQVQQGTSSNHQCLCAFLHLRIAIVIYLPGSNRRKGENVNFVKMKLSAPPQDLCTNGAKIENAEEN